MRIHVVDLLRIARCGLCARQLHRQSRLRLSPQLLLARIEQHSPVVYILVVWHWATV